MKHDFIACVILLSLIFIAGCGSSSIEIPTVEVESTPSADSISITESSVQEEPLEDSVVSDTIASSLDCRGITPNENWCGNLFTEEELESRGIKGSPIAKVQDDGENPVPAIGNLGPSIVCGTSYVGGGQGDR